MGFFSRLFGRTETRQLDPIQAQFVPPFVGVFGGAGYNDTGINVTELTALAASAVWSATQVISNTLGCLPVHVLDRDGEQQPDHPVHPLLHDTPNEFQTAIVFKETMMLNALLWGHAEAYIERDPVGRPVALLPLQAANTTPRRMNGQLVYQTIVGGQLFTLRPDQVFALVWATIDGISPISPIQQARQTIGLSIGLERYAAKFFSNGGNTGGILKLPPMSEDAVKNFATQWRAAYTGVDNALKVAVCPDGYDYKPTTISPENAQAIQARVHQIREVARIYRIPPHLLGDMEKASYASVEQQSMDFIQNTIAPWAVRWEQQAKAKLLLEREKPSLEIRVNLDAMLRGSTAERYAAHNTALQAGWMTVNEIRRKENLPPVDGGDVLRTPLNMAPVSKTAARGLVEDAARRAVTREIRAIQRAAKKHAGKPDELRAWATEFYRDHEPIVAKTMAAPLAAVGSNTTADAFAKQHCQDSLRAITEAIDNKTPVVDLLADFEDRPEAIADQLTDNH